MHQPLKVINLWAGPGAGKTTTAAGLFFEMKMRGMKVELVTEYAKELEYEDDLDSTAQLVIFYEQANRLSRLEGKVEWAISDSPLPLSLVYDRTKRQNLHDVVYTEWHKYENFNFFIDRCKAYQPFGRSQTEQEAIALDSRVLTRFELFSEKRIHIRGDAAAPLAILKKLGIEAWT